MPEPLDLNWQNAAELTPPPFRMAVPVDLDDLQTAAYYAMQPEGNRPECSVIRCANEAAHFTDDQRWVCPGHVR